MLQHALPEQLRFSIANKMFREFIELSVAEFLSKLYMSVDDVLELIHTGIYVGSHGSMHYRLDKITPEVQVNRKIIRTRMV